MTATIQIAAAAADSALAERLAADLRRDWPVTVDAGATNSALLVLILSAAGQSDLQVQRAMTDALDAGRHIIPVLAQPVPLPKLINHLRAADFSAETYPIDQLREAVAYLTSPEAPLPMRVLTPETRRRNRNIGLIVFVPAFLMFVIGLIAVGVYHLQAPTEEFTAVETYVVQTRDVLIGPTLNALGQFLPRSTAEAEVFDATLQRMPTVHRPFMEATATAAAVQARPTAPDVLPLTPANAGG